MSKPDHHHLAAALGVRPGQIKQLMKRGMPACPLAKAKAWFEAHGMQYRPGKPTTHEATR